MLISLLLEVALLLILPIANLLLLSGVSCGLFVFSYVGTHFTNPGQSLAKHVLIACVEDLRHAYTEVQGRCDQLPSWFWLWS